MNEAVRDVRRRQAHLIESRAPSFVRSRPKPAARWSGLLTAILASMALAILPMTPAPAATIDVTNDNDSGAGSLRAAILSASPGDTIAFTVSGPITPLSPLTIGTIVTIDGGSVAPTIVGTSATPTFLINSSDTLALLHSGGTTSSSSVTANGVFDISQTTAGASITTLAGAGGVALGAKTLTISNGSTTFSGVIADGGSGGGLTISGGVQTLSGVNTYTGATTIGAGATLVLSGANGSIANSSGVIDNGTFDISGSTTSRGVSIASLSGSSAATVTLGSNLLTLANATGVFAGLIQGVGGSIVITSNNSENPGLEVFSGANTFTGGTTVVDASLQLDHATAGVIDAAGSGGITLNGGVTLEFAVSGVLNNAITIDGAPTTIEAIAGVTTTITGVVTNLDTFIGGNVIYGAIVTFGSATDTGTIVFAPSTLTANGGDVYRLEVAGGVLQAGAGNSSLGALTAGAIHTLIDPGATLDFNGNSATIGSLNDLNGAGGILTNSAGATTTIDGGSFGGAINGAGAVTFDVGVTSLSGANGYTGATTINPSGTLALTGAGSIAASSGVVDNGVFNIFRTSGASITTLSGSGTVVLGGQTLTLTNQSSTFSGAIGGAGGLTLAGAGTETLTGANGYTGQTSISAGTLALSGAGAIASSSAVAVGGLGTFDISQVTTGASIVTLAGLSLGNFGNVMLGSKTLTITNGSTEFGGVIADGGIGGGTGGNLTIAGGTELLYGVNTYTGQTTIAPAGGATSALLALGGTAGSIATSSGVFIATGGTFDISRTTGASITTLADYPSSPAGGTVSLGLQTLTITNGSTTFSGVIADGGIGGEIGAGGGNLTIAGGTQTLAGVNTFTGLTTISAGTLALSGTGSIASSSGVVDNATFDISGTTGASIMTLSGSGTVTLGAQTLTLTNQSTTFSGAVGGTGALTLTGAGTETLTGANGYTGLTTISAGTLALSGAGSIAVSSGVADNGVFDISGTTAGASITTLSGSGAVAMGAQTLTLTNQSSTFSGVIGGTGGLTLTGAGTETLAGANGYTGLTTISAGTLALSGAGSIASSSNVVDNATFDISGTNAGVSITTLSGSGTVTLGAQTLTLTNPSTTFSGAIGGTGGLTLTGAGTETLTGTNGYTGLTTISAGTLALSGAGSIASSSGVADSATFDISGTTAGASITTLSGSGAVTLGGRTLTLTNQSSTFSGAIGGSGGLTLTGAGTETLTGANAYSGGTHLDAGTLAVGNSAALGTGPLTMLDGTVLQFTATGLNLANAIIFPGVDPTIDTGAGNETISGVISGTGGLTKIGSGSLDLTASNTYTGATIISAGELVVDDSIASSSSLTIAAGATLGGSGIVPGFVVPSGATVAPGAVTPYSTLKVAGALGFLSGSTYVVQVNAAGASDKIAVTGAATLSGGTVNVVAASGVYSPLTRYTILTADGGVAGTFGSLTTTSNFAFAFVTPTLSYDADDVYFGFAQTTSFPSVAQTPNQRATATAIQALGAGAPIYDAVIGQSVAGARQAFDALSGEMHASAVAAAFEDMRLPREAVLDRLSEPYGPVVDVSPTGFVALYTKGMPVAAPVEKLNPYTAWAQGFGDFGHIGGNGNAAGVDRSLGGFTGGVDFSADARYRVGFAVGYTDDVLSAPARSSSGSVENVFGGLYGGAALGSVRLRSGALVGYNQYSIDRSVAFPGFSNTLSSSYGGYSTQLFGELGYHIGIDKAAVEPFVGGLAMHISTDSFTETGGAASLTGLSRGYDYGATTLGLRAETPAGLFSLPVFVHGALAWQHVFGPVSPTSVLAFASAPANTFAVSGAPIARDAVVAEVGVDWRLTTSSSVGLFYSGSVGAKTYDNSIKGRLEVNF